MTDPLVTVDGLEKYYYENDTLLDRLTGAEPEAVQAVDGVSFRGPRGRDARRRRRVRLRKADARGDADAAPRPHRRVRDVRRRAGLRVVRRRSDAFRRRAQVMFQDPFSQSGPADDCRRDHHGAACDPRRGNQCRAARARRESTRRSVSPPTRSTGIPRVLRRAAPAHRIRPRTRHRSGVHRPGCRCRRST